MLRSTAQGCAVLRNDVQDIIQEGRSTRGKGNVEATRRQEKIWIFVVLPIGTGVVPDFVSFS